MRTLRYRQHGFTLMELAIVIGVIAILSAMLVPLVGGLADADHAAKVSKELKRVYEAIVGNAGQGDFGYLGDVGDYPNSLMDLIQDNGAEGWNGPYLTDVYVENNSMYDSFGTPLEYYHKVFTTATADFLAIVSKGPDRGSTNLSETPNQWQTWTTEGIPQPTEAGYDSGDNADNIVFPNFTDHSGQLRNNNVGELNINIFSYDLALSRYVPACPNMFEIKLTSTSRPSDIWGDAFDTPGAAPTYSPGGASFDLLQGTYRIQIRTAASQKTVWDETVSIAPGSTQTKTINLQGTSSTVTSSNTLSIFNNLLYDLEFFNASGTSLGTATASGGFLLPSVKGCAVVTARNKGNGRLVDSVTMPMTPATFNRNYTSTPLTFTLSNIGGSYKYLFVYANDVLIGEVSRWGNKKIKTFSNLRAGDVILIEDSSGSLVDTFPISADDFREL